MKLAIHWGSKAKKTPFKIYQSIGKEELIAVEKVMNKWILSDFLWEPCEKFFWWEKILELEEQWSKLFKVKHSITVNSATSWLSTALYACNIEPFSEVIVSPYTMSASATCILANNCIPVFADIDPIDYCLSPKSVEANITDKTTAIVFVNIFWKVWQVEKIREIADKYNLFMIEDTAQSPLAEKNGYYAWTFGDVWVYSLNYHKHVHCWEWWVIVTNNDNIALRAKLCRNHGENYTKMIELKEICNTTWWNFRLTEIQAAIAIEQIKKLKYFVSERIRLAKYLNNKLREFKYIQVPECVNNDNSYYVYPLSIDFEKIWVSREKYVEMLIWEWIEPWIWYIKPLYLLPVFQKKEYMRNGFPFTQSMSKVDYSEWICPTCESKYNKELIYFDFIHHFNSTQDFDEVYDAFKKIDNNLQLLKT